MAEKTFLKRCFVLLVMLTLVIPASAFIVPGGIQQAQAAPSATPDPEVWVTNGVVRSVVTNGDTTYIGGEFTYVGPNTGCGVPIDSASASSESIYPKVNASVRAVVSDDAGGWYIGGDFTTVGGVTRNHLAHILADGTLDTLWDPDANDRVYALALSGSIVYTGGMFTSLGGGTYTRNCLAAIDASSGIPTSWDPNAKSMVCALAVSGSTVYAGGTFTTMGGGTYARNRLAAIDASTGIPTSWDPNANSTVYALAVSGSIIYAGGEFQTLGGGAYTRKILAAIDADPSSAEYGKPTSWNPDMSGSVDCLAVSGSTIYAGGAFTILIEGTYAFKNLTAIDTTTGIPTSWDPNANERVSALAVSGSTVYAGGGFSSVGGLARNHLAAIDASTGIPTSWDPNVMGSVYSLAVNDSSVYAGGEFSSVGGFTRNHLAAIDTNPASVTFGHATSWDPNVNNNVYSLAVSGSTVYVGGSFNALSGGTITRHYLAAIDASTGIPTAWDPYANADVYALAVSGSTVYAGGSFTWLGCGAYTRKHLAAIDADPLSPDYGKPTSWNPNADDTVWALAVSGSTVYAGGEFYYLGGHSYTRSYLAAIDASTGIPTSWDPTAAGTVYALAVSGSTIYVGGRGLTAIDASTGIPTSWHPGVSNNVRSVAVSGPTVYAGGDFTYLGGRPYFRNYLAAIDASTGIPTSWNPNVGAYGPIFALAISGTTVYVGGRYSRIGDDTCAFFAAFNEPPTVTSVTPASGMNDGPVSVTDLAGSGFRYGASVSLKKTGEADIAATGVTVVSGTHITCDFDLTGAAAGDWDVVVTNTDGQSGTLAGGFTVLSLPGTASGTVTASGYALSGCDVRIYPTATGTWTYSATTDSSGHYTTPELPAGDYKFRFYSDETVNGWYGNATTYTAASIITINPAANTPGIDIDFTPQGTLSGTVTALGSPLASCQVRVYPVTTEAWTYTALTDTNGYYQTGVLPPGTYKLRFYKDAGTSGWYGGGSSYNAASLATVDFWNETAGIDANLNPKGTISGDVTASGSPLANCQVRIYPTGTATWTYTALTDANGHYLTSWLPAGGYKIRFYSSPGTNGWYGGATYASSATVTVSPGADTPDIDFALIAKGTISGSVTLSGSPLANCQVRIYDTTTSTWTYTASTDASGNYASPWLAPGDYKLRFYYNAGTNGWYGGGANYTTATPVTVSPAANTSDINEAF